MSGLPHRYAAIIGIDAYSQGLTPLRTAVSDASAVAATLAKDHGYREPMLLLNADASRDRILQLLREQLPEVVEPESALVLYFAGHGKALPGDDGPQGYIFPHDADVTRPETWLAMSDLRQALDQLACRHLLVVLDCCFAGSFRWSATRASRLPALRPLYDSQYARYLESDAWQVLTSASHQEEAQDVAAGSSDTRGDRSAGHSPFAAALLRALSGDADSSRGGHASDGVITATELYQYVFASLVPVSEARRQTPGLWPLKPGSHGQFIFGNPRQERDTRPDPPLDDTNNPWRGLESYRSEDTSLFFGRDRVIEALEARLTADEGSSLIAVVGASGTGKSSVIRAGLLPRLAGRRKESESWIIARCDRLGADPEAQLAAVLEHLTDAAESSSERHRLLFIDQFEELYTQCPDVEVRERFLSALSKLLAQRTPRIKVLLTVRSDFEAQLNASPSMASSFAEGRFLVPNFSSSELREIIEGPAQIKALYFEPPELVDTLVDEVMAMPGGLPLLSFALAEVYCRAQKRRRETGDLDRALTHADYRAAGGVTGALHRRASELYDTAEPDRQALIRRLFLRMVSLEGGRLTRRRVSRRELDYGENHQKLVESTLDDFIDARLWVASGDHVEPAHDTLVVAWEKVSSWLSACGTLELQRQLWHSADGWSRRQRAAGLLWDGDPRLPQTAAIRPELNRLECSFVDTSIERRSRRRWMLGTVAALVVVALTTLTITSFRQARLADRRLADAVTTVQEIEFTIDAGLRPVAGAAPLRNQLQGQVRRLLDDLKADDDLDLRFQLAANYDSRGELALRRGDLEAAAEYFREGARVLEEMLAEVSAKDPRRLNWQSNLTVVHQHLGRVALMIGDLETAQTLAQISLERSQKLSEENPAQAMLRRNVGLAYTALGDVAAARGDLPRALELYERALTASQRLSESEPDVGLYQRDIGVSYAKLAELAVANGAWQDAQGWFQKGLEVHQRLVAKEPGNANWRADLAQSYSQLGLTAAVLGDGSASSSHRQESLRIREELARAEPDNVDWQRNLASAYLNEGDQLGAVDPAGARNEYQKALGIVEALLDQEPGNTESLRALIVCHLNLGMLAEAIGDLEEAKVWYSRFRDTSQNWVKAGGTTEAKNHLANAYLRLGGLATAAGDPVSAREHLEQGILLYRQAVSDQPDVAPLQSQLVQATYELGQLAASEGELDTSRELYLEGIELAERLAEIPEPRGLYVFSALVGYQLLIELLHETEPETARRYLERYREVRTERLDLPMIQQSPQL